MQQLISSSVFSANTSLSTDSTSVGHNSKMTEGVSVSPLFNSRRLVLLTFALGITYLHYHNKGFSWVTRRWYRWLYILDDTANERTHPIIVIAIVSIIFVCRCIFINYFFYHLQKCLKWQKEYRFHLYLIALRACSINKYYIVLHTSTSRPHFIIHSIGQVGFHDNSDPTGSLRVLPETYIFRYVNISRT